MSPSVSVTTRLFQARSAPAVWTLAVLAGLGGALAPGAPTGLGGVDLVLRVIFALLCTLLASKARRWAWVVAAVVAVVGSYNEAWVVLALFALVLGVASLLTKGGTSGTVVGALVGASVAQVALRLSYSPALGVSAALAAVALLVLVAGGAGHAERPTYRWLGREVLVLGVLVVAAAVLAGVATLHARTPAELGLTEAEAGLAAAQSSQPSSALADLKESASHLAQAHGDMARWWAKPGEVLPVISQNERTVSSLTAQGADVVRAAVVLVDASDTSSTHQAVGSIDLAKLTSLGPSVDASLTTVRHAQSALNSLGSPWLVSAVSSRLTKLSTKVDLLETDENKLSQAVKVLPRLLGADGSQRYLVMVQDPAELRGGGGLIGDQAILTADDGHLSLGDFAAINGLPAGATPLKVNQTTDQWAEGEGFNLTQFPQNDSFSPDFPTDARLFESSATQMGTSAVDGVISVDPTVLQAILSLTGPVTVPGWPVPLSTTNVLPILLHQQYLSLQGAARQAFLATATSTIFNKLTQSTLPGPLAVARAFAPAVTSKHLLVYSNNSAPEKALQTIGVGGAMPAVNGDFLEVVTQNGETDKIDWYLRRSFSYAVTYNPASGKVDATLSVTLKNTTPSSGEPAYVVGPNAGISVPAGTAYELLNVYTPLSFVGGQQDGKALLTGSQIVKGRNAYSAFVAVAPGSSTTVTLRLSGTVTGGSTYKLDLADQPAVAPDKVAVSVKSTSSWHSTSSSGMALGAHGATLSTSIDSDHDLSVGFAKGS